MPSALVSTGVQFPDNTIQRRAFPSGGILMWYGNLAFIPSGWVLCDGTNGTPDLRDRFVVCAGSTYSVGDVGGSNSVVLNSPQLPSHTHPVTSSTDPAGSHTHSGETNTVPTHRHPINGSTGSGPAPYGGAGTGRVGNGTISTAGGHGHTAPNTGDGGSHSHPITISVGNNGSNDSHENRPPFYALVYLMRT